MGLAHMNHTVTYKKSKKGRGIQVVGNESMVRQISTGVVKSAVNTQGAGTVISFNTVTLADAYQRAFNGVPSTPFSEKPLLLKSVRFSTEFTNCGKADIEIDIYWCIHKDTQISTSPRTLTDYWNQGLAYERGNDGILDTLNTVFQSALNVKEVRRRFWIKKWSTKLEGGEKREINITHNVNRLISQSHMDQNIFIRGITSELAVVVRGTLAGVFDTILADPYASNQVGVSRAKVMFINNLRLNVVPLSTLPRTNQTNVAGLATILPTDSVADIDVDADIINTQLAASFV